LGKLSWKVFTLSEGFRRRFFAGGRKFFARNAHCRLTIRPLGLFLLFRRKRNFTSRETDEVWFSQFLGLQIGTQFCPGMMIGNPKIIVGARIEFFVARKLRRLLVL
jgi:hypothetical protein